jgi:hypothetical protein
VTSRADEIHKLITDIDSLLAITPNRLSRLLSSQPQEPRDVLLRIRDFLVRLGEGEASESSFKSQPSAQPLSPLLARFMGQGNSPPSIPPYQPHQEEKTPKEAQLRSEFLALMQPLQEDLSELLQERKNLIQEIRQLEQKRLQSYSITQQLANQEQMIAEFLQVLMGRLESNLMPQLSQNLAISLSSAINLEPAPKAIQPVLESPEQLERLATLGRELDQHLLSLDGTVNVVFEGLQRNIQTYHQSLSQALARMHSQGMQGEQFIAGFLNNLTQYVQQQSSGFQPSVFGEENVTLTPSLPLVDSVEMTPPNSSMEVAPQPSKSPPLFDLLELQPVLTEPQTAPEPLALIEPKPTSVTPILSLTDDLDTVLSQIVTDDYTPPIVTSASAGDEVDQLYASLFGAEGAANYNLEVVMNEVSAPEAAKVPDPWQYQQPEPGVGENQDSLPSTWETLFFTEEPSVTPPEIDSQLASDLLNQELDTNSISQPREEVVDSPPVPSPVEDTKIEDQDSESPADNYVPASPQENLLSTEETKTPNIPDIFLNEEQLRQLDRDLANFDRQVDSFPDPTTDFDEFLKSIAPVPNPEAPIFSNLDAPHSETEVDFTPKHEVVIPRAETPFSAVDSAWYLGIDLGTTGISAALLNRSHCVVYPIYWSAESQPGMVASLSQSFRLPAEVYLPHPETESTDPNTLAVIAPGQLPDHLTNNLYSAQLKTYLQVAIPYKNSQEKWEPVLQLNEFSTGPLIWVVRSLSKLLLTLKSAQGTTTPSLNTGAVGLESQTFSAIINQITGVICTCPASWSEQYRFNIREAILASQIVVHPQQVFFMEEAIASLLPELDGGNGESIQFSDRQGLRQLKTSGQTLRGNTLAINIGASSTEMALVELPPDLGQLTHNNFLLHSFAYAGKGLEQDIICQLLLPPKSRQFRREVEVDSTNSNPWHWQPTIPGLDQMQWQSLKLEELEIPRVGEPDFRARIRLQQRLEGSLLGQAVLDAALALKLILQHQDSFTLELADQRWVLQRRDLESQVFVPFVRRLNRELNKLLLARGIPTEAINQAIITGGVAAVDTVNRWLRQKLPNAKIIQDPSLGETGAANCSRVALGLTLLPLHPQILEVPRQQYTDYFLFNELLKVLPNRPLSFGEVIQIFEGQGINTRNCQQRLLGFLEDELPAGLIPSSLDFTWLTPGSQENPDYQAIASASLFEKQGSLTYRPNSQQLLFLRHYLEAIQASTQQSLDEPYTVNLSVVSSS